MSLFVALFLITFSELEILSLMHRATPSICFAIVHVDKSYRNRFPLLEEP